MKNMLAGVGGIDLVLFVVAADESIKPQTREHFEICRLLGIRKGIVALTKADLVDPEIVELVSLEVGEFVARAARRFGQSCVSPGMCSATCPPTCIRHARGKPGYVRAARSRPSRS